MTFFVETNHDGCYSSIMEGLLARGVTYSKDQKRSFTTFEIMGTPEDYFHFKRIIDNYNQSSGRTCGIITEGV
jgi:hypothetical protein